MAGAAAEQWEEWSPGEGWEWVGYNRLPGDVCFYLRVPQDSVWREHGWDQYRLTGGGGWGGDPRHGIHLYTKVWHEVFYGDDPSSDSRPPPPPPPPLEERLRRRTWERMARVFIVMDRTEVGTSCALSPWTLVFVP